jgi:AI-2 transport protein TqsA
MSPRVPEQSHFPRFDSFRRLFSAAVTFGSILLVFYVLTLGKHFFVPLVIAFLAVYLIEILGRVVSRITIAGHSLPRPVALFISALIIFGISFVLGAIVADNAVKVAAAAPRYQARLHRLETDLFRQLGVQEPRELLGLAQTIDLKALFSALAASVADLIQGSFLVVIYALFILLELRFLPAKLVALFPDSARRQQILYNLRRIDRDIHTYLGVKTAVSLTSAVLAYILMRIVGLDFAEFWALLLFVLHFIPTIGIVVATLLPTLLAAVQFDHWGPCLAIGIGITAIAQFMGNVVEPNVMGETLNLSPLTVILSLILWGSTWGITGAFLCVPLTVICVIVLSNFKSTRWISILLSKTGQIHSANSSRSDAAEVVSRDDARNST